MADKSNAMTQGHALWQRVFREVGAEYPEIEARHIYIDALAMLMVQDPSQFEVIVTNNLFGDIITDLGAALQGGLGLAASGNIHPGRTSHVRAGPRVGAAARGQERREPDGRDPVRGAHARIARPETGSRGDRSRGQAGGREREGDRGDRRNARHARDGRLHHEDLIEAILITKHEGTRRFVSFVSFVASVIKDGEDR